MKKDFAVLEELVQTLEEIGYEKTVEVLKSSRNLIKDKDLVLQEYIINCVCKCFSISKKELLESKNPYTDARAICSIELKGHIGYSQSKIASILRRDDSVISKYIKRINFLDEGHREDRKLIDKIDDIEKKVREFKTNIINKQ